MLEVALSHRLGGFVLDLSFTAPPGITALFGRSGAGKTSIVNAVAGLLRPDAGRVVLGGEVLLDTAARRFVPPHRRRIGYVFQDARLFPHLTVRQNLLYGRFFAPAPGAVPGDDLARITELLGLGHLLGRRPGMLSGGEKARVALGRALLSNPRLLLLDEPLAALDQARRDEIMPHLERLRDEAGLPVLFVSHSLADVTRLATTVVLVEGGRLVAAGPVASVLASPEATRGLDPREAGAVIRARVAGVEADGLTRLETAGGPVFVPGLAATPGRMLQLRVPAQDVMLALAPPAGISALNVLAVRLRELRPEGAAVLAVLDLGEDILLARVTARSAAALALAPGQRLFAVLKTVALAPAAAGLPPLDPPRGI